MVLKLGESPKLMFEASHRPLTEEERRILHLQIADRPFARWGNHLLLALVIGGITYLAVGAIWNYGYDILWKGNTLRDLGDPVPAVHYVAVPSKQRLQPID